MSFGKRSINQSDFFCFKNLDTIPFILQFFNHFINSFYSKGFEGWQVENDVWEINTYKQVQPVTSFMFLPVFFFFSAVSLSLIIALLWTISLLLQNKLISI